MFDDENVSVRKRRQRGKLPLDEEAVGPERDMDRRMGSKLAAGRD